MRELLLVVALVACGKQAEDAPQREAAKPAAPKQKLDKLTVTAPDGFTGGYNEALDTWGFTSKLADGREAVIRVDHAPRGAVASPDAMLHHQKQQWDPGVTATIEKRESLKDGFAFTAVVTRSNVSHRETYVVRQLGTQWIVCANPAVADDAMRDETLALCKSLTAPR